MQYKDSGLQSARESAPSSYGLNGGELRAERRRATGCAVESREGTDGEPVRSRRKGKKTVNSDFSDGKLGV